MWPLWVSCGVEAHSAETLSLLTHPTHANHSTLTFKYLHATVLAISCVDGFLDCPWYVFVSLSVYSRHLVAVALWYPPLPSSTLSLLYTLGIVLQLHSCLQRFMFTIPCLWWVRLSFSLSRASLLWKTFTCNTHRCSFVLPEHYNWLSSSIMCLRHPTEEDKRASEGASTFGQQRTAICVYKLRYKVNSIMHF